MENFQELFLASLHDGSYNDGLREKVKVFRDKRHLGSLRCIEDTRHGIESTISEATVEPMVISDNGWTPYLKWEEMANTILKCDQLSQSRDQPSYYPPVPEYNIPQGRKYTSREIRAIQATKRVNDTSNFVNDNVTITTSPMTAEEFAVSMKSLIQISPSMFNSLKIYEQVIRAKKIVTTPHFSSTEIIKQVGHLVTLKVDSMDHVVELIGIYVLQNPTTLKTLIEFLSNLDVSNTTDLMETINYLRELSWSITPKQ